MTIWNVYIDDSHSGGRVIDRRFQEIPTSKSDTGGEFQNGRYAERARSRDVRVVSGMIPAYQATTR